MLLFWGELLTNSFFLFCRPSVKGYKEKGQTRGYFNEKPGEGTKKEGGFAVNLHGKYLYVRGKGIIPTLTTKRKPQGDTSTALRLS